MAAIITEHFRKNTADLIKSNIQSDKYYIGIGKSDEWYEKLENGVASPFPLGSYSDMDDVQYAITDLIRLNSASSYYVIPNIQYQDGGKYKQYNPYDPSCFYASDDVHPCYIVDSEYVYLCLHVNISDSTYPGFTFDGSQYSSFDNNTSVMIINDYVWIACGKILRYSYINNEQFVAIDPSQLIDVDTTRSASGGLLYGFYVMNGGSDYTPGIDNIQLEVKIKGLQYNADFDTLSNYVSDTIYLNNLSTDSNGVITNVQIMHDAAIDNPIKRLTKATVEVVSGGNGNTVLVPLIAPIDGFGHEPRTILPSWYLGLLVNTRVSIPTVYSDYSQISIIRNPKDTDNNSLTNESYRCVKSFVLSGYSNINDIESGVALYQINNDIVIPLGVVDSVDYANETVYYISSAKYGYCEIDETVSMRFINSVGNTVNTSILPTEITIPTFKPGTGEVIFIDNRATINRAEDQNEELKIIIQL